MGPIRLPVLNDHQELRRVECTECGRCCTYLGIGINPPRSARYATDILWYLYHEHVYVYVDGGGEWSVHFEARCRNLGDDLLCRIYAERPHICRGFDNRTCEVNDRAHASRTFRTPAEFLTWLRERRPKLLAKIESGFVPKPLRQGPRTAPGTLRQSRRSVAAWRSRRLA